MDRRGRARCPGCGRRRVLYAQDLGLPPICHGCGMLVSYVRSMEAMGAMLTLFSQPEVVAELRERSESFARIIEAVYAPA